MEREVSQGGEAPVIQVPQYPRNLSTVVHSVLGVSTNRFHISPQSATTLTQNSRVVFELPSNSVVYLPSLALMINDVTTSGKADGAGTTTADLGNLGVIPNAAALFDRVDVFINGIQVQNTMQEQNTATWLTALLKDNFVRHYTSGVGEGNQMTTYMTQQAPTTTGEHKAMYYTNIMGMCSESSCQFLDTSLVGQVRLEFVCAPNQVLAAINRSVLSAAPAVVAPTFAIPSLVQTVLGQDGTDVAYEIKNFHLAVDCISIADGFYTALQRQKMIAQKYLTLNIKDYYSLISNVGTSTSANVRFSVSSGSIDKYWGSFRAADYNVLPITGEPGMLTKINSSFNSSQGLSTAAGGLSNSSVDRFNPKWFNFSNFNAGTAFGNFGVTSLVADNIDTFQYAFYNNNVQYPSQLSNELEAFNTVTLYNEKQKWSDKGCLITSQANYRNNDFVNMCRFNLPPSDDQPETECRWRSGADSRNVNSSMIYRTQGMDGTNKSAYILVECTAQIRYSLGKSVARLP